MKTIYKIALVNIFLNLFNTFSQSIKFNHDSYLVSSYIGNESTAILQAGDAVNDYKFAGIPDGLGAFENGDGTFTLLVNHEFGSNMGKVREHGSNGSFVSKWIINKSDLSVISGEDLIKSVYLWNNGNYVKYDKNNISSLTNFTKFCSGDLASTSAFYDSTTQLGTTSRIYLNGEENGTTGRGFAHIVTGPMAGSSYELPLLGKMSMENAVANPNPSNLTIVASLDDSGTGQIYIYIGSKSSTGNEIEKAGLTNGKLYGVSVKDFILETSNFTPNYTNTFSLIEIENIINLTGEQLQNESNRLGITTFVRPEDGTWNPNHPEDFYFATTSTNRIWKLHFNDINNPLLGGSIVAVLNGDEGQLMPDNICMDSHEHVLFQEDVGGNEHLGRIFQYNTWNDELIEIANLNGNYFSSNSPNFLTNDEETSGIIDMEDILGKGYFLSSIQAHFSINDPEIIQGGQIVAFYNEATNLNEITNINFDNETETNYITINSNTSLNLKSNNYNKIEIIDINGKLIKEIKFSNSSNSISTENLNKGIYFVRLLGGKDTKTIKLLVN